MTKWTSTSCSSCYKSADSITEFPKPKSNLAYIGSTLVLAVVDIAEVLILVLDRTPAAVVVMREP